MTNPRGKIERQSEKQLIQEQKALAKRVKELEKALEFARLETEARDILIDIAEERYNIPIRNKTGDKQ